MLTDKVKDKDIWQSVSVHLCVFQLSLSHGGIKIEKIEK